MGNLGLGLEVATVKTLLRSWWEAWVELLYIPLELPFLLTTEKDIIIADVNRWSEILEFPTNSPRANRRRLISKLPEFRSLYYFRLGKGNLLGRIPVWILKRIYQGCTTLFIEHSCSIGPGLFLQHAFSTIIMADLGENCWVNQQVTIGYRDRNSRPCIGNHVRITAGAKLIGGVSIGDYVTVGANAVVVKDVPDRCVVVGIPAYIVKRNGIKVREELV
ncbi:MAG: serine acetyltransferase [Leptolyngbyaceae cyanobacterium]